MCFSCKLTLKITIAPVQCFDLRSIGWNLSNVHGKNLVKTFLDCVVWYICILFIPFLYGN